MLDHFPLVQLHTVGYSEGPCITGAVGRAPFASPRGDTSATVDEPPSGDPGAHGDERPGGDTGALARTC